MKTLLSACTALLLIAVTGIAYCADTRISGPDGRTRAYIDDRGRISGPDGKTLGYVERGGRVSRPDGSTAGYLENSGDVVDTLTSDRKSSSHTEGRRGSD